MQVKVAAQDTAALTDVGFELSILVSSAQIEFRYPKVSYNSRNVHLEYY